MTPSSQTKIVGQIAYFFCDSKQYKDVKWVFQDGALPPNVIKYSAGLGIAIYITEVNNTGIYKCYGLDENLLNFVAEGELHVKGMF